MKVCAIVFAVIACALGQNEEYIAPNEVENYPHWYVTRHNSRSERHRRDVTIDHKTGNGRVFGTLGQNNNGLFGKGGYEHNIFDDHRGKLDGSVHGTHVLILLTPYSDSSHVGGSLNCQNSNAAASLVISRQIHGRTTTVDATAGERWPIGKNADLSAQGYYSQTRGMRDYGGRGVFNYRF